MHCCQLFVNFSYFLLILTFFSIDLKFQLCNLFTFFVKFLFKPLNLSLSIIVQLLIIDLFLLGRIEFLPQSSVLWEVEIVRLQVGCLYTVDISRNYGLVLLDDHLARQIVHILLLRRTLALLKTCQLAVSHTHWFQCLIVIQQFLTHIQRAKELSLWMERRFLNEGNVINVDDRHWEFIVAGAAVKLIGCHRMHVGEVGIDSQGIILWAQPEDLFLGWASHRGNISLLRHQF